ncbi:M48 family metalloprotease [Tropheryma whipplei]|uniref:M48 family metalloprotease n=1 Tax=Tropheryma whipplei TaxID=2039 RepID=UPI0009B70C0A|nr:M48 family metalloprotease [Tropheryma whipplei]MCO8190499.1 M48 family metalloprotease [Tropheryma whipplei]
MMYSFIARNKINTFLILFVFILACGGFGLLAGRFLGMSFFLFILLLAAGYACVQYFFSGRLAVLMSGARKISRNDNPRLWNTVENLSITTGLPMPEVYIVDDPAPNAFATGRDPKHAKVAATSGLLEILDDSELEGVMAHEMGHVKNYDIRVSTIVFGLVSAVGLISDMVLRALIWGGNRREGNSAFSFAIVLFFSLLAPIAAMLVQLAVSREREYLADATGALTTRYPAALASALAKLEGNARPLQRQSSSMAHLWISNPMPRGFFRKLFSTHPPTEERIRRLKEMGNQF